MRGTGVQQAKPRVLYRRVLTHSQSCPRGVCRLQQSFLRGVHLLGIHQFQPISPSTPLRHRSSVSHDCIPPSDTTTTPASDKNAAAKALLAKHFGVDSASSIARPSSSASRPNAQKEAQQRQLIVMRMRHKAQPGNPKDTPAAVPVEQRLHLKVTRAGLPSSERIFWFPKVSSIYFPLFRFTAFRKSRR